MPSTVIRRFAYDAEARRLVVTFTTSRVYAYADVPADLADQFRAAFSKGIFSNQRIRDRFDCTELDPAID